jgi:hypothetical protein
MPRKLQNKAPLAGASPTPNADIYRVLEVNINAENNSVHVFWGAYESQDDIVDNNVPNPAYVDAETTPDETEFITVVTPVADVKVAGEGVLYNEADAYELFTAPTQDGENAYDAFKRICYAKLEADGYFPTLGAGDSDE